METIYRTEWLFKLLLYMPKYLLRFGGAMAIGAAVAAGIYLLMKHVDALKTRILCTAILLTVQLAFTLCHLYAWKQLFTGPDSYIYKLQSYSYINYLRSEVIAYFLPLLIVLIVQILRFILRSQQKAKAAAALPPTGNAVVFSVGTMLAGISNMLPDLRTAREFTLLTALHQNPAQYILCGAIPAALGLSALILSCIAARRPERLQPDEPGSFQSARHLTARSAILSLTGCVICAAAMVYFAAPTLF